MPLEIGSHSACFARNWRSTRRTASSSCVMLNCSSSMTKTCSVKPFDSPSSISFRMNNDLSYCGLGITCGAVTNRVGLSILIALFASTVPERNVIDEICPSPVARKLSTNRRDPFGTSALVRVPDERWIEERGRFERIFGGEIGADEEPPFLAQRFVGKQVPPDAFEAFQEISCGAVDAGPGIRASRRPEAPTPARR